MFNITFSSPLITKIHAFDSFLHEKLVVMHAQWHMDWLTSLMLGLTHIGDPLSLLFISVAVIIVFWLLKEPIKVIQFATSMIVASGAVIALKHLFIRTRPIGYVFEETGYSFPSGHALVSAVFFPLLFYICKSNIKSRSARLILGIVLIGTMFLIAYSRLYFGVHYLSDVLAGLLVGGVISSISIIVTEGYKRRLEE